MTEFSLALYRESKEKLLDMVKSSLHEHPLLVYRSDKGEALHKYLGIAGAIYGIYGQ